MTKTAAVLTVRDVPDMTKRGRKSIAEWLRKQADLIESNEAKVLARECRMRYQYEPR